MRTFSSLSSQGSPTGTNRRHAPSPSRNNLWKGGMDGLEKEDAVPQKSPSFSNSQSSYSILHMLNFAVDASADRCVVLALDDEGGRRAREARKKREQTNVEGIAVIPLHEQGTQAGHDARD